MPTIAATRPDTDIELPVALAARIAGIDRVALADLLDQNLISDTGLETVRALGSCGQLRLTRTDDESPLVLRLDPTSGGTPIGSMSDDELVEAISGPHRVSPAVAGRDLLVTVRGFIIARCRITGTTDPAPLTQDRRGRDVIARRLVVQLDGRIRDITDRPSKAKGADRWLGRRAVTTAGGSMVELAVA